MGIDSWFTIIGFFIAIFGFLIKDELKIFLLKLNNWEKFLALFTLFVVLPFLLFYKSISSKLFFLNKEPFVWNWGIKPENIAFILFCIVFIYLFCRISIRRFIPKNKINENIVNTYVEILEDSPSNFWKTFLKYEDKEDFINDNWEIYEDIIFHPLFLESSFTFTAAKNKIKKIPKIKEFSPRKMSYYQQLVNNNQLEELFRFYLAFEKNENVNQNWPIYKNIFLNNKFLFPAVEQYSGILLEIWHNIDNEQDFSKLFLAFLENRNSDYYQEIREHWNSYSLLPDKPLLNIIIKDNLRQSIDNGLLIFIADYIEKLLQSENGKLSIYNQEHFHPRITEVEGWELSVYYHIRFIGIIYSTAIEDKVDISMLSNRYRNIISLYSCVIENILNNMTINEKETNKEGNSNYHWLINKIFDIQREWAIKFFKKDQINLTSSYQTFIPASLASCIEELYKGYTLNKITYDYLYNILYYDILNNYYDPRIGNSYRESIENEIICKIPDNIRVKILERSLKDKYAKSYDDFKNENYTGLNGQYIEILNRLKSYLESKPSSIK